MKKFILLILFIFLTLPIFASNWIIIDAETQISKQHLKSYNTNSNIKADIFYSYLSKDMNVVSNSDIYINLEKDYDIEIAYCIRFILINATQQKYTNKSIALFDKNEVEYQIDIQLRNEKSKGIAINGVKLKKAAELLGIANIIIFL